MPPFILSLLLNRYTIGALLVAGLAAGAYWKGYSTAAGNCRDAELRAQIAAMERDLAAWKAADDVEKLLQQELNEQNADLQDKVKEYELELAQRPDAKCALDAHDIERLRFNGGR